MARARSNTRAARHPLQVPVVVLAADRAGLGHVGAELAGLVVEAPQRGADRHRRDFAAGVLVRPRHAGEAAIFLGQARVEHAAEIDVAGRTAGADDDRLAGADVERGAVVVDRDPEHRPERGRLAVDRRHPVFEQDLDAGLPGRGLQRAHQAVAR